LPAVVIKVGEGKCTDGSLLVLDKLPLVLKLTGVTNRVGAADAMVAVSSNHDIGARAALCGGLRPNRIGEAWCHVWHSDAESILEASRDGKLFKYTVDKIIWDRVCPDSIVCGLLLMIVHHELLLAVAV